MTSTQSTALAERRDEPSAANTSTETFQADDFRKQVREWAARMDVHPQEARIRRMKHKWASCSTRGRLTFDQGLLEQSSTFRTEVIVHELLHLKLPNHGKLFHALLRAYLAEAAPDSHGASEAREHKSCAS